MLFDLKLGTIKDFTKYVVSLDQLHSFMCFAIIKNAVFTIFHFTRFSLMMHNFFKIEIESQKSKLYLSNHGRPYLYICKSNMLRGKNIVGYDIIMKFKRKGQEITYWWYFNFKSIYMLHILRKTIKVVLQS